MADKQLAEDGVDELWGDSDDEGLLLALGENGNGVDKTTEDCRPSLEVHSASLCVDSSQAWEMPPLTKFRYGYLRVTDLTNQMWCEQQLEYSFTQPVSYQRVDETPAMKEGASMHLARELEVQDSVAVKITGDEDIFAVKIINLIGAANSFLMGTKIRREIPIFGAPFGEGVLLMGIIDQIECDIDLFTFDLWEYKTRAYSKSFPPPAQKNQHKLQLMLYKKLWDDIVTGITTKELISEHLYLDLDAELGDDIQENIRGAGIVCSTLGDLLDEAFERMKCLPCITQLLVEYAYQVDQSTIGIESVVYDDRWLQAQCRDYMAYWKGQRPCHGVDIEEAYKCQKCEFADVCTWRQAKAEEHAALNTAAHKYAGVSLKRPPD